MKYKKTNKTFYILNEKSVNTDYLVIQINLKFLTFSAQMSIWYTDEFLNTNCSHYMSFKKKNFMNLFQIWEISVINANRNFIYIKEIETLKLVLNNFIFYLWDTHYTLSVFATLVFLNQLDKQSYNMKLIQTNEKLHYFHLINLNE